MTHEVSGMKKELYGSALIIGFCSLLIWQALQLPPARFETLGPSFFPLLVLGSMVGLSLLHILLTLFKNRRPVSVSGAAAISQIHDGQVGNVEPDAQIALDSAARRRNLMRTLGTLIAFTAYGVLLDVTELPYTVLTLAFVTVTTWMLGDFRPRALRNGLAVGIGITGFIYVVFGVYLRTVFP